MKEYSMERIITLNNARILVVEDDIDISQLIKTALFKEGLSEVKLAGTLHEGLELFNSFSPNLVILDSMLPDGEGYELCKAIRTESHIPIIFLSAKSDEIDKILGLAIGGDDYMTKPFSPKELAYRVKAQLRRSGLYAQQLVLQAKDEKQVGLFSINENETEISKNNKRLHLTAKELGLMLTFLNHPNQILSKESLFQRVRKEDFYRADNTVMVHIRRLREKIEVDPSQPKHIVTIKGLGYRFIPE